jgi:glycosyltransferase involved in cell wall biosynthesis
MAPTLGFLTAVYNEEREITDLLDSVRPYVDEIVVSDDGSRDNTVAYASKFADVIVLSKATHSCEETRIRGLKRVLADWVLILDADERIPQEHLAAIKSSLDYFDSINKTHVYFYQVEVIDGRQTRSFEKVKLARRDSLHLPEVIHADIGVDGDPINVGWQVIHRKSSEKQKMRELEYLHAYEQKVAEGKMTREWANKVREYHYFHRTLPPSDSVETPVDTEVS